MTSRVLAYGNGARGVLAYCGHDGPIASDPRPRTTNRLAGIAMRGMPTCDLETAGRIIQNTITDAPLLKKAAGISNRGRKLQHGIAHVGLSWADDERPTWAEMQAAGDSWLQANGLDKHRVVMLAHDEAGKPSHMHLVTCLVNPETGRAHRGNLALGGSRWAQAWEEAHGGVRIQTRVERNIARDQIRQVSDDLDAGRLSSDEARTAHQAIRSQMPAAERTRSNGYGPVDLTPSERKTWHQLRLRHDEQRQELEDDHTGSQYALRRSISALRRQQRTDCKSLGRRIRRRRRIRNAARTAGAVLTGTAKIAAAIGGAAVALTAIGLVKAVSATVRAGGQILQDYRYSTLRTPARPPPQVLRVPTLTTLALTPPPTPTPTPTPEPARPRSGRDADPAPTRPSPASHHRADQSSGPAR